MTNSDIPDFPEWKDSNTIDPHVGATAALDLISKLLMECPLPATRHNELVAALQFIDYLKASLFDTIQAKVPTK